jgi:hypothetical protein
MDINSFNLDQEYFGFGGGFRQLPNSNTSFLNFGAEDTPEYQRAVRKYNTNMEDLINDADKKAETDRFNNEIDEIRKNYQKGLIKAGVGKIGDVLKELGIKPKTTESTTQITASQIPPPTKSKTWLWVTLGVLIVGGTALALYKFKK